MNITLEVRVTQVRLLQGGSLVEVSLSLVGTDYDNPYVKIRQMASDPGLPTIGDKYVLTVEPLC